MTSTLEPSEEFESYQPANKNTRCGCRQHIEDASSSLNAEDASEEDNNTNLSASQTECKEGIPGEQ